jgi:hypothetical protein
LKEEIKDAREILEDDLPSEEDEIDDDEEDDTEDEKEPD